MESSTVLFRYKYAKTLCSESRFHQRLNTMIFILYFFISVVVAIAVRIQSGSKLDPTGWLLILLFYVWLVLAGNFFQKIIFPEY